MTETIRRFASSRGESAIERNAERAARGARLAQLLAGLYRNLDDELDLADALADLLHHGALGGAELASATTSAQAHYAAETRGANEELCWYPDAGQILCGRACCSGAVRDAGHGWKPLTPALRAELEAAAAENGMFDPWEPRCQAPAHPSGLSAEAVK